MSTARSKNAPPTKTDLIVIAHELGVRASTADSSRDLVARLILAAGAIRGELGRLQLRVDEFERAVVRRRES